MPKYVEYAEYADCKIMQNVNRDVSERAQAKRQLVFLIKSFYNVFTL
jgi:hypothetical protein